MQRLFYFIDQIIFIGAPTYASYHKAGITVRGAWRIESPFLPPIMRENAYEDYPQALKQFIKSHSPRIVANAYQCCVCNGKDLYGIDQCIEMIQQLRLLYPHIGLVLFLVTIGDQPHYDELVKKIDMYGLRDSVEIVMGNHLLWPVFAYADCFVRPTINENYGMSVAEALYCKVPTIASDVCERAPNALLYPVGDIDMLVNTVKKVLHKKYEIKK